MTMDNFHFYLQNRLIQTGQTGGQLYSDTSPLVFPELVYLSISVDLDMHALAAVAYKVAAVSNECKMFVMLVLGLSLLHFLWVQLIVYCMRATFSKFHPNLIFAGKLSLSLEPLKGLSSVGKLLALAVKFKLG
jgi:hypothetical protein